MNRQIILLMMILSLSSCLSVGSKSNLIPSGVSNSDNLNPDQQGGTPGDPGYDPGAKVGFQPSPSSECNYFKNLWGFDDEYFCEQWHLANRGIKIKKVPSTTTYADSGTSGVDIKAESALKNYSGEGIKIYVTDDGLFHTHPDIKNNYIGGYNNCTGENNSWPGSAGDNHGTMVSGIIAAEGGNGIGVTGISHNSKIFVNNYIGCQVGQSQMVKSIVADASFDIWSGSFGIGACAGLIPRSQHASIYDAYTAGANNNILYFKANGNDNQSSKCEGFGNTDPSNGHYAVASIAALDHKGAVTSYSTRGANLSLAAFAGYGGSSSSPGIVTISDQSSYTSNMNGTSAATPITSGSAGLLLDAFPGHKWYEYQVLLLRSATQLSESETSGSPISGINNVNYLINDAGYRHSYHYGLGAVDIDAAIDLGKKTNITLPKLENFAQTYSGKPTSSTDLIDFSGSNCAIKSVNVNDSLQIFSMEASFDISISNIADLMIFMITPKGKVAQLLRTSKVPGTNLTHDQYFKSMQGFAMDTKGEWKFKVCGKTSGVFKSVKLDFYGFKGFPIPFRKN